MQIEKSGFYKIQTQDTLLTISDNTHVCIFDDSVNVEKILVGKGAVVHYFLLHMEERRHVKKHFLLSEKSSQAMLRSFIFSQNFPSSLDVIGEIGADEVQLDMQIVSIVGELGDVSVNGIVQIHKDIKKVEGYLKQQNIFLAQTGKVRGIPTLIVHSNDVKASHGCNIEKIRDDQLFYLRSRGISQENAKKMMIESYIKNTFGYLEKVDENFYTQLIEKTLFGIH